MNLLERCFERASARTVGFAVVVFGAFAVHVASYSTFLSDDALISLRYAQRLVRGLGLTWTDGERVEGYTDFLWVLLTAAAGALGFDLVASARALGLIGGVVAIACVSCSTSARVVPARLASGGLSLALCPPLAAWVMGGLEHAFMAGVLSVAFVAIARVVETDGLRRAPLAAAGCSLGALALLRADGIVLVAFALFGGLLASKLGWRTVRSIAFMAFIPVVLLAAQLAFRYSYYGELVPNTALAKVAFNVARVQGGFDYVARGHASVWPMYTFVVLALVVGARGMRRERWLPAASVLIGWTTYVALVGGDIFPAWRQLLFAFVALSFILAEVTESATRRLSGRAMRTMRLTMPALALGLVAWQSRDAENVRAHEERWEWDGYSIGNLLRVSFGDRKPLLAVDAAGALPFWSELPSLDMLGLNDAYIAKHPPPDFGHGGIGHELGDGAYVLGRHPDLVAFNGAAGGRLPVFRSGTQLVTNPRFRADYQFVRVRGRRGTRAIGELYIRREGGRLGVVRTSGAIRIPGYFFGGGNALAEPDDDGRLVTLVRPDAQGELPEIELPQGTYRLEIDSVGAPIRVGFLCGPGSPERLVEHGVTLEVPETSSVRIVLATAGVGTTAIRSARLVRTEEAPSFRCRSSWRLVDVPLDWLSGAQAEHTYYADPENVAFGPYGIRLRLPERWRGPEIELSVDNADVYLLTFMDGDERLGRVELRARVNGGGLAVHRIEVPAAARERGFDSVLIDPRGDGAYAIGHFRQGARAERAEP